MASGERLSCAGHEFKGWVSKMPERINLSGARLTSKKKKDVFLF